MNPAESSAPRRPKYQVLSPRCWHGMSLGPYLRMLHRNRFRVHPLRWPLAAVLVPYSCLNSLLSAVQHALYGRQIRATQLEQPPLFVLGHWRTGTTYLHRLLACDDRLAYPTLYEVMAANHFVLTESLLKKLLKPAMPKQRPMDPMSLSLDAPEEDEFAQVAMGGPTILYRMAFPNHPLPYPQQLDMVGVSEQEAQQFRDRLLWFLQALTFVKRKPLVLKYPGHTGRLSFLAEMFPGARFIHMTREPTEIFASTRLNWQAMDYTQGLQIPHHRELDEFIFETFRRMYLGFEQQRDKVDPAKIVDLRYEQLVSDPIGCLASIYSRLNLGDFEYVRPQLEQEIAQVRSYRARRHAVSPELEAEIRRRWDFYYDRYGY